MYMKKIIPILLFVLSTFLFTSCDNKKELYAQVDYFVEQLDTHYEHYDMFGNYGTKVTCGDRVYSATPIGRLINVKIEDYVPDSEYEKLRKSLEKHYKGDRRVIDVYICQAGTVMVDCRR